MEARYRSSKDDSYTTLRIQKQKIQKLRRDNHRLQEELVLETRQAQQTLSGRSFSKSGSMEDNPLALKDQIEGYVKKIEVCVSLCSKNYLAL